MVSKTGDRVGASTIVLGGPEKSFSTLIVENTRYNFVSIRELNGDFACLPYALKILAENVARRAPAGLPAFVDWLEKSGRTELEIEFSPGRVLMHDTTCVPALVDIATLRDEVVRRGFDPALVNPQIPVDLVIDHSVMVDRAGTADAFAFNLARDFERNAERYAFIHWAQESLENFRVVPPATGILHQVNLEHLSEVVRVERRSGQPSLLIPDTLVGTDSHTPMVNALGVLAWGVGGLEGEAAALGQPLALRLPEVVGIRLRNRLRPGVNATDLALTLTEILRHKNVVEKMIEFFGEGVETLSIGDRATVANMAPEYGATCSMFAIDSRTLEYLRLIGKTKQQVAVVEAYARAQGLWQQPEATAIFTRTIEFDLASVEPSLAGPRRPQDRVPLSQVPVSFKRMLAEGKTAIAAPCSMEVPGHGFRVENGVVLIAAITSCTNTSNPHLMMAAGLVARNARRLGLTVPPWVKTSLAPGSHAVPEYLKRAGLQQSLDELGFNLVGYGCTTCIGNSGEVDPAIAALTANEQLIGAAVLSGNRNFEDRINPSVRAAYLASPALVVAYALAGSVLKDLTREPIARTTEGRDVMLTELWPSDEEIDVAVSAFVRSELFGGRERDLFRGPEAWRAITGHDSATYPWQECSTYLRRPPYFEAGARARLDDIYGAQAFLVLGDSVTTDHISPAGAIPVDSAAGEYLCAHGVAPAAFNQYSTRRGNHEVMLRGVFSNRRLRNELVDAESGPPLVKVRLDGRHELLPVYEAVLRYSDSKLPLLIFAGRDYGGGSSRDWAAKGPRLAGVRAVIAESFERIHRSNLIGMGILPLQLPEGTSRHELRLTGEESFDLIGLSELTEPLGHVTLHIHRANGTSDDVRLLLRAQTATEVEYLRHGGLLPYVLERLLASSKATREA